MFKCIINFASDYLVGSASPPLVTFLNKTSTYNPPFIDDENRLIIPEDQQFPHVSDLLLYIHACFSAAKAEGGNADMVNSYVNESILNMHEHGDDFYFKCRGYNGKEAIRAALPSSSSSLSLEDSIATYFNNNNTQAAAAVKK